MWTAFLKNEGSAAHKVIKYCMSKPKLPEYSPADKPIELTARQNALRAYLDKRSPGLGNIYYGMLVALQAIRNPENIIQAAHSGRELISRLHEAFPDLPQYSSQANAFGKLGELITLYRSSPTDRQLRDKIAELDKYYELAEVSRRQRYEAIIEGANKGNPVKEKEKQNAAKGMVDYQDWFTSVAHHGRPNTTESEFRERLTAFEYMLEGLITEYFEVEKSVQRLMDKSKPNQTDVDELQNLFLRSAVADYFFRNITNSEWLLLLKDAGFFSKPFDIIIHEDGAVSCPSWPQSSFLMKCADSNPSLVSEILQNVEDTENARVHQELVEIAQKLPSSLLISFANRAKDWINNRYNSITLLPDRLAGFVRKLATENQVSTALIVADTILDVRINEEKYKKQQDILGLKLPPEAEAYVDDWHYERLLEIIKTALIKVAAIDYLTLLCKKLSRAIRIEHKAKGDEKAFIDYTYISRPAIENHEQNTRTDRLKDHLIDHIRDISFQIVQESGSIDDVLSCLRQFKYPVFLRIELYLLTEFSELGLSQIVTILRNKKLFSTPWIHYEFYRFLEKSFGNVEPEIQKVYYDWISSGPNLEHYKAIIEKETGIKPSLEQLEAYVGRWKLRHYNPIVGYLNCEHKAIYNNLMTKFKIEQHPEFLSHRTSWIGPTSPLDNEDLRQKSVEKVIKYLTEWIPSGDHCSPSSEGLGRFFKDDVRNRAMEYAQIANSIDPKVLRPVYIYYYFSGLEEGIKNKINIDWQLIIKLFERIVMDNNLAEPDKSGDDFETGWVGVRKQVASLISEGLKLPNLIPFNLRENVWDLIERLCGDSDPTIEFEAEYGGSNMSPVDMSINTVRGEAVHCLFHYLNWVDENLNLEKDAKEKRHSIPEEAKPVIEKLLNTVTEPTLTIRSIIGWYIQWLAVFDLNYIKNKLDIIIPKSEELKKYRDAAFEGYFSFNRPDGYLFRNIRKFFIDAFDWSNDCETEESFNEPKQNYVKHLTVFYWWGIDPLNSEDCLIKKVFTNGNIRLRSYAVESIGRSLETLLPIGKDGLKALKRLEELLDWRLFELEGSEITPELKTQEMKEFGWWFTYAQMNMEWLIDTLLRVLSITKGKIEWTHGVIKRLNEFIEIDAYRVAKATDLIVHADPVPWNIDYWEEHLSHIFEKIKNSGHKEAWEICVGTIHFIGERGSRSFGKYL
ncbi:MAG: hypothetical protein AB1746_02635 [Candidatus Zixiibacteriota bacterium]